MEPGHGGEGPVRPRLNGLLNVGSMLHFGPRPSKLWSLSASLTPLAGSIKLPRDAFRGHEGLARRPAASYWMGREPARCNEKWGGDPPPPRAGIDRLGAGPHLHERAVHSVSYVQPLYRMKRLILARSATTDADSLIVWPAASAWTTSAGSSSTRPSATEADRNAWCSSSSCRGWPTLPRGDIRHHEQAVRTEGLRPGAVGRRDVPAGEHGAGRDHLLGTESFVCGQ